MLERRELLSGVVTPSVVVNPEIYLTVPVQTSNGEASGTYNSTSYTANPANLTGTVAFSSQTAGTITGNLSGTITTPANGGTFAATIPASGSTLTLNTANSPNLTGNVAVTSPSTEVVAATGNISVTSSTSISWSQTGSTGSWTGTITSTDTTPFGIALTTPYWDSAAETQIDFGFTNAGTWDLLPTASWATPVASIAAYWNNTPNTTTNGTEISGQTFNVYWNSASGTASVQNIPSNPGYGYLVIALTQGTTTAFASLNLSAPLVTGVSPVLGPLAGGTTVTITGAGFTGATAVNFGTTVVPITSSNINTAGTQITVASPLSTTAVTVDVTVTNSGVNSPTSAADKFTYNPWTILGNGVFTSSGKADVLWENTSTGQIMAWITGGGGLNLGTVPSGWTLAGIGDFTGNGIADLVWQNTSSGEMLAWLTGGGGQYLGTVPSGWTLAGIGDVNGDKKADLVWQNTSSGEILAWLTGGGGQYLGTVPSGWTLAGVADFNGDGKADLLWQNTTSGVMLVWLTGGTGLNLGTVPSGWTLAGIGDFNGDKKADLVWQNDTSGVVLTWITGGSGQYLGTVPLDTGWTLAGVGDFNDDGLVDLLWQNTSSGEVLVWITDGSGLYLGTV